jgi:hypothetical protein
MKAALCHTLTRSGKAHFKAHHQGTSDRILQVPPFVHTLPLVTT